MRRFVLVTSCVAALASVAAAGEATRGDCLSWTRLPDLPDAPQADKRLGRAGAFAGVHNDVLIFAGGANFPAGWPRDARGKTTPKVYHRDIYVLQKAGQDGKYAWHQAEAKLARGYSYGASIPTDAGLVCIGGEWKEPFVKDEATGKSYQPHHLSSKVFVLKWDAKAKRVEITDKLVGKDEDPDKILPLPPLPVACAYIAGARIADAIYVAGGNCGGDRTATAHFWRLDLSKKRSKDGFAWESLPPWPGPARWKAAAAAQSDGETDCFYLFSGTGPAGRRLTDAYRFNPNAYKRYKGENDSGGALPPRKRIWLKLADVGAGSPGVRCVDAAPAGPSGANHILVFGGDDGEYYRQDEHTQLTAAIAAAEKEGNAAELKDMKARMEKRMVAHPGFPRDILAYHTITDTWIKAGLFPTGNHVTTNVVQWGDDLVIPSGEIRPGVRSPNIWKVTLTVPARFGWVNYAVLGVYLAALVAMGVYFSKREKTTDDFFRAGRRIPWWAAGLSVFGTMLSAITFMAIPAKLYATNWLYLISVFALFLMVPVVTRAFIPFYRRLDVTTAYEYLEKRFNVAVRMFGSITFLLMQFGRIGIVLLLPSIALSVVTGINVYLCIAVMGVLATVYTVMGGMEAVIWTDVLQVFVLMAGAIISLVLIVREVPGGASELYRVAYENGKLECVDFSLDFTTATVWVLLLFVPNSLIQYASDQAVIQRYLTTRDEKSAARGLWLCAFLGLAALVFWAAGTALYGFYRAYPARLSPALAKPDAIFPWYIVNELPAGVADLVIAGVFAASMSSLDSSMNSMSAAVVTDFYRRFGRGPSEASCLRLAKIVTGVVGVLGTVFALTMAGTTIKSIWDQFNVILGLFGGSLAGLFLLGMFTRRGSGRGAMIGLIAGSVIVYVVKTFTPLHFFLYGVTGMFSCIVIGYVVSRLLPEEAPAGLTVYDIGSLTVHNDASTAPEQGKHEP